MQKDLSPAAIAGTAVALVALLGGLFWLGSGRKSAATDYSDSIAKREGTAQFQQAAENYEQFRQENKEALRNQRRLNRDKEYQPEYDGN